MKHTFFKYSLLIFCLLLGLSSCEDEKLIYQERQHVLVLFSPGGLGDRSYNDQILKGLQDVRRVREDMAMSFYSPNNMEEAQRIFSDWLALPETGEPSLFILASSAYEDMATNLLSGKKMDNPNKTILLFETSNPNHLPVHCFRLPMYGSSYIAGYVAGNCPVHGALAILGNGRDKVIQEAAKGFQDGFAASCGGKADTVSLAYNERGYMVPGEAYQKMNQWTQDYEFFYPLAGGSNMGVYRFLRESSNGIFASGVDVDQSELSSQIVGSAIKLIDLLVARYVNQWLDYKTMPDPTFYGLESGYTDWLVSPNYDETFQKLVNKIRNQAIEKEEEFYEKN